MTDPSNPPPTRPNPHEVAVSIDAKPRTWTDRQVAGLMEIAFGAGQYDERRRIANVTADLDATWINHARVTYEERVAQRAHALAPGQPDWLQRGAERLARHDATTIDIGRRHPPAYSTWRQVHAGVTPAVWERIYYDLSPTTQAQHADIAPASARGYLTHLDAAA